MSHSNRSSGGHYDGLADHFALAQTSARGNALVDAAEARGRWGLSSTISISDARSLRKTGMVGGRTVDIVTAAGSFLAQAVALAWSIDDMSVEGALEARSALVLALRGSEAATALSGVVVWNADAESSSTGDAAVVAERTISVGIALAQSLTAVAILCDTPFCA